MGTDSNQYLIPVQISEKRVEGKNFIFEMGPKWPKSGAFRHFLDIFFESLDFSDFVYYEDSNDIFLTSRNWWLFRPKNNWDPNWDHFRPVS